MAQFRRSRIFSASKQKIICEIVRQGYVRDFMEHMLNRGRIHAIGTEWNIHFSTRFCRSVSLNESESFGFLWVLVRNGIVLHTSLLSTSSLSLCQTIFLPSILQTFPHSSLFLAFSVISFVLVFTPRIWLNANLRWFSIYKILLHEKNLYVVQMPSANMFLCTLDYFLLFWLNLRKSIGVNDTFPSYF